MLYRPTRGSFFQSALASEPLTPQDPNEAQPRPAASPVMDLDDARATPRAPPVGHPNGNDEWEPYASSRRLGEPPALDVLAPAGDPLALPHTGTCMLTTPVKEARPGKATSLHEYTDGGNHAILVMRSWTDLGRYNYFVFVRRGSLWYSYLFMEPKCWYPSNMMRKWELRRF